MLLNIDVNDKGTPKVEVFRKSVASTRSVIDQFKSGAGGAASATGALGGAVSSTTARLTSMQGVASRTVSYLKQIGTAVAAGFAVKEITATSLAYERIGQSLEAVKGSSGAAAQEFSYVSNEAERLGLNLKSSATAYAGMTAASKGTRLEGQATREIFSSISEASAKLGLDVYATEGALKAIEQMMSKGNVQAEELRGQLGERLPGAFQIASRAMGVTTAQLDKMLKNGEVTAENMLPKFAEELRKTFGTDSTTRIENLNAGLSRVSTALDDLKRLDADGMQSATGAVERIVAVLKTDKMKDFAHTLTGAVFAGIEKVSVIAVTAADHLDALVLAAKSLIAVKVASWAGGYANAVWELVTAGQGELATQKKLTAAALESTQARAAETAAIVEQLTAKRALAAENSRLATLAATAATLSVNGPNAETSAAAAVAKGQLTKAEKELGRAVVQNEAAQAAAALATARYTTAAAAATIGSRALAGALGVLRGLYAALGGPVGVILLAGFAVVSWINYLNASTREQDEARESLDRYIQSLKELKQTESERAQLAIFSAKTDYHRLRNELEHYKQVAEETKNLPAPGSAQWTAMFTPSSPMMPVNGAVQVQNQVYENALSKIKELQGQMDKRKGDIDFLQSAYNEAVQKEKEAAETAKKIPTGIEEAGAATKEWNQALSEANVRLSQFDAFSQIKDEIDQQRQRLLRPVDYKGQTFTPMTQEEGAQAAYERQREGLALQRDQLTAQITFEQAKGKEAETQGRINELMAERNALDEKLVNMPMIEHLRRQGVEQEKYRASVELTHASAVREAQAQAQALSEMNSLHLQLLSPLSQEEDTRARMATYHEAELAALREGYQSQLKVLDARILEAKASQELETDAVRRAEMEASINELLRERAQLEERQPLEESVLTRRQGGETHDYEVRHNAILAYEEDLRAQLNQTGYVAAQTAQGLESAFGEAFVSLGEGVSSWKELFLQATNTIKNAFLSALGEMIAKQLMLNALTGGSSSGSSGSSWLSWLKLGASVAGAASGAGGSAGTGSSITNYSGGASGGIGTVHNFSSVSRSSLDLPAKVATKSAGSQAAAATSKSASSNDGAVNVVIPLTLISQASKDDVLAIMDSDEGGTVITQKIAFDSEHAGTTRQIIRGKGQRV